MAPTPPAFGAPRATRGAPLFRDELLQHARDHVGALEVRHVAGAVDRLHARAGDPPGELVGVDRRHEAVLLAPDQERRRGDAMDALLEALVGDRPDELARGP